MENDYGPIPYGPIPVCWDKVANRCSSRIAAGKLEKPVYANLEKYSFFDNEKAFICGEINGDTSHLDPTCKGKVTPYGVSVRYHIPERTVRSWVDKFKSGHHLQSQVGRPGDLDIAGVIEVDDFLRDHLTTRPSTPAEFNRQLMLAKQHSLARRGIRKPLSDISMDHRTIASIKQCNGWKQLKKQKTTEARVNATHGFRAVYRQACFFEEFGGTLPAVCKHNIDATTVCVSMKGNDYMVVPQDPGVEIGQLKSIDCNPTMDILIKWMHHSTAYGEGADPSLIVGVNGMPPDTFFTRFVVGITQYCQPGSGGWLYFSDKKCGTFAMWKHYFMHVTIPFIRACVNAHKPKDVNGDPCAHLLMQDGENVILEAAQDEEVLDNFSELNVISAKGEPSFTSLGQACDVSHHHCFEILKEG
jgi:hypothetical protein